MKSTELRYLHTKFVLGAGTTIALFLVAGAGCTSNSTVAYNNRGAAEGARGDLDDAIA